MRGEDRVRGAMNRDTEGREHKRRGHGEIHRQSYLGMKARKNSCKEGEVRRNDVGEREREIMGQMDCCSLTRRETKRQRDRKRQI